MSVGGLCTYVVVALDDILILDVGGLVLAIHRDEVKDIPRGINVAVRYHAPGSVDLF